MTILHILLALLFLVFSCLCIYTDLKDNIIPNNFILIGAGVTLILQLIDVICFKGSSLTFFYFTQMAFTVLISFLFYAFKVWAGGDTKLYILLAFMMPVDFFAQYFWNSVLSIVVMAYAIAFIYIMIESIVLTIRKEPVPVCWQKINWKDFGVSWVFFFSIITVVQRLLHFVFGTFYNENSAYFVFLNVFLIFILVKIRVKSSVKLVIGIILLAVTAVLHFFLQESMHVYLSDLLIVAVIYFLRIWGNQFNYKNIAIDDLKPGMIPSALSVIQFTKSKVKGLPENAAEDMSARISQEEVESIKRWAKTKNGEASIWIVRKIPFALFICVSYTLFMLRGIYGQIF